MSLPAAPATVALYLTARAQAGKSVATIEQDLSAIAAAPGKYRVTRFDEATGAVIGASTTGNGAFAVADARPAGASAVGRSRLADAGSLRGRAVGRAQRGRHRRRGPRQRALARRGSSAADGGRAAWPRRRLVAVIRALDGTWRRPFTTLELAALQNLVDPGKHLELEGLSDSAWLQRIGNCVPPAASQAIGSVIGKALLLAWVW
jgi:site-specific DNA-cytosine methylase